MIGMKQHWRTWNTPLFEDQVANFGNNNSLVPPHMMVLLKNGRVLDRVSYSNWLGHCGYNVDVVAYCFKMTKI